MGTDAGVEEHHPVPWCESWVTPIALKLKGQSRRPRESQPAKRPGKEQGNGVARRAGTGLRKTCRAIDTPMAVAKVTGWGRARHVSRPSGAAWRRRGPAPGRREGTSGLERSVCACTDALALPIDRALRSRRNCWWCLHRATLPAKLTQDYATTRGALSRVFSN